MDKRYIQSRFYNGVKASDGSQSAADNLVRKYVSRFSNEYRKGQNYGGSTGGLSSTNNRGLYAMQARNIERKGSGAIFEQEGHGVYGARKEFGKARELPSLGG